MTMTETTESRESTVADEVRVQRTLAEALAPYHATIPVTGEKYHPLPIPRDLEDA